MCGIAGIFSFDRSNQVDMSIVKRMCNSIAHRGPDHEGFYNGEGIGLGVRRLSIIDLAGGNQPIYNEDKTLCIILNGEIYNYRELAAFLKSKGHIFRTKTDTEVIVHGFEEHGLEFINRLTGMFAFALYDSKHHKLYLVRDRLGIKPLFYSIQNDGILFGSEIKAILQHPSVVRSINLQALFDFFSYGYVPQPETIINKIKQVPPGHYAVVDRNSFNLHQYWDINFASQPSNNGRNIQEKLLELLENAVSRCLVSDVPVGLFLSSGVDSNTLLALMKKNTNGAKLSTFTIGYGEKTYNEIPLARESALKHDTSHHELYVTANDFLESFDNLIWHCDSLLGDFGHILNFKMQQMASDFNKVAIIGAGGDELFVGYPTYQADKILPYYQALPQWLQKNIIPGVVNRLPVSLSKLSFDFKLKKFIENSGFEPLRAHYGWKTVFTDSEKKLLFNEINVSSLDDSFQVFSRQTDKLPQHVNILNRCLYADMKTWLPEQLYFTDTVSMAHSVENRLPFLDHELVEFAFSMPFDVKMKGLKLKHLLKQATANVLTKDILKQKKLGAGSPFPVWIIKEPKVKELVSELLLSENLRKIGIFNTAFVTKLLKDHINHKANNGYKIWCLLAFAKWHELYIQKSPVLGYHDL